MNEIKFIDQWDLSEAIGLPADTQINWTRNRSIVRDQRGRPVLNDQGKEQYEDTKWVTATNQLLFDAKVMVSMHDDIVAALVANPTRKDLYIKKTEAEGAKWKNYTKIVVCKAKEIVATTGGVRPVAKIAA